MTIRYSQLLLACLALIASTVACDLFDDDNGPSAEATVTHEVFGYVWADVNGNGLMEETEPRLPGITVRILSLASGQETSVAEVTTSDAGYYGADISGVAKSFAVQVMPPAGASFTQQGLIETEHASHVASDTGRLDNPPFLFDADTRDAIVDVAQVNAGLYLPITGIVWQDLNADGIMDEDEPGVGGVAVSLYQLKPITEEQLLGTIETDEQGSYELRGIPGAYPQFVVFAAGDGAFTTPGQGDELSDSDVVGPDGRTDNFTPYPMPEFVPGILATGTIWDAGLVTAAQALALANPPTATPTPTATVPPTATPTPTATSIPPLAQHTDPAGDPQNCATKAGVDNSAVDVLSVNVYDAGILAGTGVSHSGPVVGVLLAENASQTFENDFSFALALFYRVPIGVLGLLYEIHDREFRIGPIDTSFNLLHEGAGQPVVVHPPGQAEVWFLIPSDATEYKLQIFHTRTAADMAQGPACDQAPDTGLYVIP